MSKISKYILLAGASGILLSLAVLVFAQTDASSIPSQSQDKLNQVKQAVVKKLGLIKDKVKQGAANKIVEQMDRLNKTWTDHFANVLDHLDAVLQKIKSRADKASANGQDMTAVTTAIQNAESKIAAAKTAVASQAKQTYAVDATKVSGASQGSLVSQLKAQFTILKDKIKQDLTGLRDGAMKDAKTAVQNALQALSQVPNVDNQK